jgi:hypothetical protein
MNTCPIHGSPRLRPSTGPIEVSRVFGLVLPRYRSLERMLPLLTLRTNDEDYYVPGPYIRPKRGHDGKES